MNLTITVPDGSSNYGNPNILCTPPHWHDYILFYLANYFAHAATIITRPGQGLPTTVIAIIAALLPVSGIARAIEAIRRHSITETDLLKHAARAGALCMVVKAPIEEVIDPESLEAGRAGIPHTNEAQHDAKGPPGPEEIDQNVKMGNTEDTLETGHGLRDVEGQRER